ncbi:MAG TPA: nitrilase-related carbon-nitrogen hydrolase [Verrucomicrobiae bacterium]|jgi:apolipoprotein N-acyltransferase|nr:nitrilase-related carbon-nitrogen hydrolase [Verrucomicrobiae bacterium]
MISSSIAEAQAKAPRQEMRRASFYSLTAVASFHLAYTFFACAPLIIAFLYSLYRLSSLLPTNRQAFYFGLAIGLAIYIPQLAFFWTLFQVGALPLWIILSCWLAAFVVLGRACLRRFGVIAWACAAPFVWLGLEYFRSELYYFRFSWLSPGYVFSETPWLSYFSAFGVYGTGFVLMALVSFVSVFPRLTGVWRLGTALGLLLIFLYPMVPSAKVPANASSVRVAGIQFEFAPVMDIREALDIAVKKLPEVDVFVLSEYSFTGPIPDIIRKWCLVHHKYLIAGGEDVIGQGQYYNVAYVVGPDGSIVFQQAKCVPVQLMKDGLAAKSQKIWNSPWGKIGLAICYDASYTRVLDELVRQGAEALIIPTMDVVDWGARQHKLHGRVGPMRSAEYRLPIFRLCSSGISQIITASGVVSARAPYPGSGSIISGQMTLTSAGGKIPPDRLLAFASVVATGFLAVFVLFGRRSNALENSQLSMSAM